MRCARNLLIVVGLLLCLGMTQGVQAQEVSATTTRSAGVGEALTAGASGSAALWHNPAGILSAVMYAAETSYAYDSPTATSGVTASLLDTKSNPSFGLGLSFTYEISNGKDIPQREGYHFRGSFAFPLVDGFLKVGSTIRYSAVDIDETEVLAAMILDVGVLLQPLESFSIGVTGLNLINGGYDEEIPPSIAAGFAFSSFDLGVLLSADVVFDLMAEDNGRTWRAGGEYLVMQTVPVRLGYNYNEQIDDSSMTFGLGFRDAERSVGLDAAYKQSIDNKEDRSFFASLSIYL